MTPLVDRFWAKVQKHENCWQWLGATNDKGYGQLQVGARSAGRIYAHRLSYELHVEPLDADLVVDHKCRNTRCVNPAHLEAVTNAENIRRSPKYAKTSCAEGHSPEDYVRTQAGRRYCRGCNRERMRKR